jgi:hypothetical protein
MTKLNTVSETGSMPIAMAVNSTLTTQSATSEAAPKAAKAEATTPAKTGPKKDRAYFSRAIEKATITFYRSGKAVADLLLEARLNLSPEDFKAFIKEDCKFDFSLVCKFIKMAADYRLNDPANDAILPEAWTARYEIMLMKESTFRMGVAKKIIHAECKLDDLRKFRDQIEGKKDKKAKGKKTANPSASPATPEAPKPASATDSTPPSEESKAQKAAVKPPVNNSALRVAENVSAAEPAPAATGTATATAPAKGRIAIVLSKAVAGQHKADLDRLKEGIEALVKEYDFIGAVEVEVAA